MGTDWSDKYRARPVERSVMNSDTTYVAHQADGSWVPDISRVPGRPDSMAVVEEVRRAAREEAARAAEMFGQQARAAARDFTPLITDYTSKISRWFKILTRLAILLLILWLAFQIFAQASFFDWVGDRIDNITDRINNANTR
jgi:hypothetical protein